MIDGADQRRRAEPRRSSRAGSAGFQGPQDRVDRREPALDARPSPPRGRGPVPVQECQRRRCSRSVGLACRRVSTSDHRSAAGRAQGGQPPGSGPRGRARRTLQRSARSAEGVIRDPRPDQVPQRRGPRGPSHRRPPYRSHRRTHFVAATACGWPVARPRRRRRRAGQTDGVPAAWPVEHDPPSSRPRLPRPTQATRRYAQFVEEAGW